MVVISYPKIRDFIAKHKDSQDALNNWYKLACAADWANFHEMKRMWNTVDAVGNDRYVFDIRGNSYRIVALIFFDVRTLFVRFVGTHKEYDKIDCSTI
jgi:mRNA interferase HigB